MRFVEGMSQYSLPAYYTHYFLRPSPPRVSVPVPLVANTPTPTPSPPDAKRRAITFYYDHLRLRCNSLPGSSYERNANFHPYYFHQNRCTSLHAVLLQCQKHLHSPARLSVPFYRNWGFALHDHLGILPQLGNTSIASPVDL